MSDLGGNQARRDACSALAAAGRKGPEALLELYMGSLQEIHAALSGSSSGISAEFWFDCSNPEWDAVRAAASLFDFVSIVPLTTVPGFHKVVMINPDGIQDHLGSGNVEALLPAELVDDATTKGHAISLLPAFYLPTATSVERVLSELAPLHEAGILSVLPQRVLMVQTIAPDGSRENSMIRVKPDTPLNMWDAGDGESVPPLRYGQAPDSSLERQMLEMTIPYIGGVSFETLANVLEDEGDHVSKLRQALNEVIAESRVYDGRVAEIARDVARPAVESLDRRFRTLAERHSLRVAGITLGSAALALGAAMQPAGWISALLVPTAGGLAVYARERSEHRSREAELRDDPYYLLWRIKSLTPG